MRRLLLLLVSLLYLVQPAFARDPDGYWVWERLGGDKRVSTGIWSWTHYQSWFLGPGGQNDLTNGKIPTNVRFWLNKNAKTGQWNHEGINLGNGYIGELSERTRLRGTKYNFITFNTSGCVIFRVKTAFDAEVYTNMIRCPDGYIWRIDTFKICGNAGGQSIITVTPPPRRPPPIMQEQPQIPEKPVYVPGSVVPVIANQAYQQNYAVKGIFADLMNVAAHWLGATRINFSGGNATGGNGGISNSSSASSSSSSASSTTGPIRITNNNNNQNNNNANAQSQVVNSVNTVNNLGDGTATGTATGTGNQDAGSNQNNGP